MDFVGWLQAIQKAAGSGGAALGEQQLTEGDVPVLVDRCIDYITQCGTGTPPPHRPPPHPIPSPPIPSHPIPSPSSIGIETRRSRRGVWVHMGLGGINEAFRIGRD